METFSGTPVETRATVYVVDDDPQILKLVRGVCGSPDVDIKTFESAESFLNGLDGNAHGCVVLDYRLPDRDGLSLLEDLRARRVHMPIVVISGEAGPSTVAEAHEKGIRRFLEKPFLNEKLRETVATAISEDAERRRRRAHAGEIDNRIRSLTPREKQVMYLVVQGKPNKTIATELGVSPKTIEVHRANVMRKMSAASLAELVKFEVFHRSNSRLLDEPVPLEPASDDPLA